MKPITSSITRVAALLLVLLAGAAHAQEYPSRPVKILYGFSAGGGGDGAARALAQGLQTLLGGSFVVENKTGANGAIAAGQVANAEPDGHTLLFSNPSSLTMNPIVQKGLNYNPETDFIPISAVITTPLVLVINPSNPKLQGVTSVETLIAKIRANPGKITYGSSGTGGLLHLASAQLGLLNKLELTHVPYRGAANLEVALVAGEVDFAFDVLSVTPHVTSGKLKALAVTTSRRWRELPEAPTMTELGMPASMSITAWFGLLAPAKTPAPVVAKLHAALRQTVESQRFADAMRSQGDVTVQDPQEFRNQILAELRQNAALVKALNIKLD